MKWAEMVVSHLDKRVARNSRRLTMLNLSRRYIGDLPALCGSAVAEVWFLAEQEQSLVHSSDLLVDLTAEHHARCLNPGHGKGLLGVLTGIAVNSIDPVREN